MGTEGISVGGLSSMSGMACEQLPLWLETARSPLDACMRQEIRARGVLVRLLQSIRRQSFG